MIFIASQRTEQVIKDVLELHDGKPFEGETVLTDDPENLQKCFLSSLKAWNKAEKNEGEIYVDFTGGTKCMSAGLAMACFGKGAREYIYVGGDGGSDEKDNSRTKEGTGTVKPGREKIIFSMDPSELYFIGMGKKIESLFNFGKYKLVCDIIDDELKETDQNEMYSNGSSFSASVGKKIHENSNKNSIKEMDQDGNQIKNKTGNKNNVDQKEVVIREIRGIRKLSEALGLWNSLVYERAFSELKKCQKEFNLENGTYYKVNITGDFETHLKKCSEYTGHRTRDKTSQPPSPTESGISKPEQSIIRDIIKGALKRKEHGDYDDAVLRLYRAIEFIGQCAFKGKFGCDTSSVSLECLESLKNTNIYEKIKGKIRNQKNKNKNPEKIKLTLFETYEVLNESGDELGGIYFSHENKKDFEEFAKIRHNSVLAHGFKKSTEKDVEKGLGLIRRLFNKKLKIDPPTITFNL